MTAAYSRENAHIKKALARKEEQVTQAQDAIEGAIYAELLDLGLSEDDAKSVQITFHQVRKDADHPATAFHLKLTRPELSEPTRSIANSVFDNFLEKLKANVQGTAYSSRDVGASENAALITANTREDLFGTVIATLSTENRQGLESGKGRA